MPPHVCRTNRIERGSWAAAAFYLAGVLCGTVSLVARRPSFRALALCPHRCWRRPPTDRPGLRGRAVGGRPLGSSRNSSVHCVVGHHADLVIGVTLPRHQPPRPLHRALPPRSPWFRLRFPLGDPALRIRNSRRQPTRIESSCRPRGFQLPRVACSSRSPLYHVPRAQPLAKIQLGGWVSLPLSSTLITRPPPALGMGRLRHPRDRLQRWLGSLDRDTASARPSTSSAPPPSGPPTPSRWACASTVVFSVGRFAWTCLILFPVALLSSQVGDLTRPRIRRAPSTSKPAAHPMSAYYFVYRARPHHRAPIEVREKLLPRRRDC